MKVSDFKVGDQVISDATKSYWHSGLEGEVVSGIRDAVLVRFKGYRGTLGHSGQDASGKENRQHWNFTDNYYTTPNGRLDLLLPFTPVAEVVTKAKPKSPHGKQEYKGNGKHDWEAVVTDAISTWTLKRLRVPGGWLYRDIFGNSLTFVPVPSVVGYKV